MSRPAILHVATGDPCHRSDAGAHDDSNRERWGNLGGVFFVVCTAVSFALPGNPPKTSDSAARIADFLADKADQLRWSGYIGALSVLGLFWWLGSGWRLLRRADGGTPRLPVKAVAAATFAATLAMISGVMLAALPIIGALIAIVAVFRAASVASTRGPSSTAGSSRSPRS